MDGRCEEEEEEAIEHNLHLPTEGKKSPAECARNSPSPHTSRTEDRKLLRVDHMQAAQFTSHPFYFQPSLLCLTFLSVSISCPPLLLPLLSQSMLMLVLFSGM